MDNRYSIDKKSILITNRYSELFAKLEIIYRLSKPIDIQSIDWLYRLVIDWKKSIDCTEWNRLVKLAISDTDIVSGEKRKNLIVILTSSYQALIINFSSRSFVAFIRSWSRYEKKKKKNTSKHLEELIFA